MSTFQKNGNMKLETHANLLVCPIFSNPYPTDHLCAPSEQSGSRGAAYLLGR